MELRERHGAVDNLAKISPIVGDVTYSKPLLQRYFRFRIIVPIQTPSVTLIQRVLVEFSIVKTLVWLPLAQHQTKVGGATYGKG